MPLVGNVTLEPAGLAFKVMLSVVVLKLPPSDIALPPIVFIVTLPMFVSVISPEIALENKLFPLPIRICPSPRASNCIADPLSPTNILPSNKLVVKKLFCT